MKRHFDIIGAPFNQLGHVTTTKNTVEGLRKLDKRSWVGLSDWMNIRAMSWGTHVRDLGDVLPTKSVKQLIENNQKELALTTYTNQLKSKVLDSYQAGNTPITIGGDHSIAVGTILATLDHFQNKHDEKVAVVWVDAHADCNSSLESNLHGKPLALLTNEFTQNGWFVAPELALPPSSIFYIGVRDLMPNEHQFIEREGITQFGMSYLDKVGIQTVLTELMTTIESEFDRVYLSFDYDALDGSVFRACATPNVGGLSAREAIHLVHTIASSPKFVGADFVEYLPELDIDGVSKELMIKLIDAVCGFRS
ncbi:arginase family protein [Vibrio ulleungensis]|uniref:Arginase family protein n=1 Tax=Vibrio ulleungensis TaxID=2807619 RepID=A0ABS2HD15_9VIBR|nr:arginase family protein [Vibrio ulleungensis]MBM7035488.1 arginase family protein [Vibrio ulleungensis]